MPRGTRTTENRSIPPLESPTSSFKSSFWIDQPPDRRGMPRGYPETLAENFSSIRFQNLAPRAANLYTSGQMEGYGRHTIDPRRGHCWRLAPMVSNPFLATGFVFRFSFPSGRCLVRPTSADPALASLSSSNRFSRSSGTAAKNASTRC